MNILLVLLLLLPLGIFLGEGKWRDALLYSVVIGFLQDPLRKITPDQPPFYVGLVLFGIFATASALYARIGRVNLVQLFNGNRQLVSAIELFLSLIVLQTMNSIFNLGSIFHTFIGVGFFLAPLTALWVGYQFALHPSAVNRFVLIYVIMGLLFTFTLILAYNGYQGPIFTDMGSGVKILIAGLGGYTQGYTGFWRSSEVAAWHLATCACFVLILAVYRREPWPIAVGSALTITLMVISTLTGRRKALTLVVGFVAIYSMLIAWRGDTKIRGNLLVGLGGGLLLLMVLVYLGGNPTSGGTFSAFLERGNTVWTDVISRLTSFGTSTVAVGIETAGPIGAGIGATAQGAGSLGLGMRGNFGAAEGGLGKITVELGVAGLILFFVILALLAKLYWQITRQLRLAPPQYGLINLGLIAFLAANVINFTAASQVYGDPYVLSILGLSAGFVLACPAVIQAHLLSQRQAAERLAGVSRTSYPEPAPPSVSPS